MSEPVTNPDSRPAGRRYTWTEILVIVAIVVVTLALLLDPVQWVSDGTRVIPVRIFVFNPQTGKPIANAQICCLRGLGMYEMSQSLEIARQFPDLKDWRENRVAPDHSALTDQAGQAVIEFEFSTSASHNHPLWAFPAKCWISVAADGYGEVLVTPGNLGVPVAELAKRGGFLVPVGLSKLESPSSE